MYLSPKKFFHCRCSKFLNPFGTACGMACAATSFFIRLKRYLQIIILTHKNIIKRFDCFHLKRCGIATAKYFEIHTSYDDSNFSKITIASTANFRWWFSPSKTTYFFTFHSTHYGMGMQRSTWFHGPFGW